MRKLCLPKEYLVSKKCLKPFIFSLEKWLNTVPKNRCTDLEKFKFECKNPIKTSPCDCKNDCDTFSFNEWLEAYREDPTSVDPIYFPKSWFVDDNCDKTCCSFIIDPCDNLTEEILLPKKHFKKDCCSVSFITNCLEEIAEDEEVITPIECPNGYISHSFITNESWEEYDCLPTNYSQMSCATNWVQASTGGTSDYHRSDAYMFPSISEFSNLLPFPNGKGVVGGFIVKLYPSTNDRYYEYVGTVLTEPLVAGTTYYLGYYIAALAAAASDGSNINKIRINNLPPVPIAIWGNSDPTKLPFVGDGLFFEYGNPKAIDGWELMGETLYTPIEEWQPIYIEFTPTVDTNVIVIGAGRHVDIPDEYTNLGNNHYPYILYDYLKICKPS